MPQKINPIDFENSEGNITMANGIIDVFIKKLPISRLQRDLSNSTVLRNTGVIFAHCIISYSSTLKGLDRIIPNPKLRSYLNKDWSILAEAAQTLLRYEGVEHPYRLISNSTKGKIMTQTDWKKLVEKLPISDKNKDKLSKLTPGTYRGIY
jgi:adenylosuccinate lyase